MYRYVHRFAQFFALLGGAVLTCLIILTCVSIVGRVLNTMLHGWISVVAPDFAQSLLDWGVGPVNGDFEIVEAGVAFAIFAFLPLCQLTGGHAEVDIFTSRLSPRIDRALRMVVDTVFALVLIVIAVQLFDGTLSKFRFGEETFILQFPVWWGYAASLCGAGATALVAVYVAFERTRACMTGQGSQL